MAKLRVCAGGDVRGGARGCVRLSPNNLQQSSSRTKYNIEPLLRPMEPSNNLPLNRGSTPSLESSNKVHLCSTL